jgi:hypothetical protein
MRPQAARSGRVRDAERRTRRSPESTGLSECLPIILPQINERRYRSHRWPHRRRPDVPSPTAIRATGASTGRPSHLQRSTEQWLRSIDAAGGVRGTSASREWRQGSCFSKTPPSQKVTAPAVENNSSSYKITYNISARSPRVVGRSPGSSPPARLRIRAQRRAQPGGAGSDSRVFRVRSAGRRAARFVTKVSDAVTKPHASPLAMPAGCLAGGPMRIT